jgi:hypothetical protein
MMNGVVKKVAANRFHGEPGSIAAHSGSQPFACGNGIESFGQQVSSNG